MPQSDERDRILEMIESGQVSASQAAQLLDALEEQQEQPRRTLEQGGRERDRLLRIRATSANPRVHKFNMSATLPVSLIRFGLRMGTRLVPLLSESALEDVLYAVEHGARGRVLDLQDLDKGERLEIFVE